MDGAAASSGGGAPQRGPVAVTEEEKKKIWEEVAGVFLYQQAADRRPRHTSLFLPDHPHHEGDPSGTIVDSDNQKVVTNADAERDTSNLDVQITQVPPQTRQEPTFMQMLLGEEDFELPPYVPDEGEDNSHYQHTTTQFPNMSLQGNNGIGTAQLETQEHNMTFGSSSGIDSQFSGFQASVEIVDLESLQIAGQLNNDDVGGLASFSSPTQIAGHLSHLMPNIRAFGDPDQAQIPPNLMHQSTEPAEMSSYSVIYPENTVTRGPQNVSGFSLQTYHSGQTNRNSEFHFLLEQAKNPENNSMILINIRGHIPAFSADPFGSRFIQQKLERATIAELVMVYEEIVPHARMLALDVFANYAIQKLLGFGPAFYRRELIATLSGCVVALSLHPYSCRVIQKAFEVSDLDQRVEMANEVGRQLMKCVYDHNGNHVVQKCQQCGPPQHINLTYASFWVKANMLSIHPYGRRVIQRVLESCDDREILKQLMTEIMEGVLELTAHQFGNYVVQHVVEHGGEFVRGMIVSKLKGWMVQMSCRKYGSNVMDKCLTFGSMYDRLMIAAEITYAEDEQILMVMVDQHGNKVIEKMLETMAEAEWVLDRMVSVANRYFLRLFNNVNGKRLLAHLQTLLAAREMEEEEEMDPADEQFFQEQAGCEEF